MSLFLKVLLIIVIALAVLLIVFYFLGKKAQKKQDEQQEVIDQTKQQISMLILDKKKLKPKDSGLPAVMTDQIPWYLKNSKLPIVKAKVGPKIMNFIADAKIYDDIPVKKEVKAYVSGLYITSVRGIRKDKVQEEAKKGFFSRFSRKNSSAKKAK